MVTYDKYYKKENYFGRPYPSLMEFFKKYPNRGTLCDLGAGQGRDSISLYEMGYDVTAVDISSVGLKQIKDKYPEVKTKLSDIYKYKIDTFDFILLNSIVHFYRNDVNKESGLIKRILSEMKSGSVLVNCMLKNKKSEDILADVISSSNVLYELLAERYIDYPDYKAQYHFIALKKK